ncbi:cytochrome p450 [Moniliophthora roreri MCA 2997]|uniref:Cytochrome p450 n=1 Tax=Moniliophthora roreri (strain MCA 2997) TaxID=1381753 RepID=V2WLK5_MONRO|nr:cytochrome p450 [Moniliophthora roreri MCA 2997]
MSRKFVMDGSDDILPIIALGVATHVVFHKYEPTRSTLGATLLFLAIEPSLPYLYFLYRANSESLSVTSFLSAGISSLLFRSYIIFYITLAVSIACYRLSPFHPLARVPGPTIHKITKLWGVWWCWKGQQHILNKQLHDKYGPVVRTGPNEISTIDVSAVHSVLGASGLPKGQWYTVRQDLRAPKNLLAITGEEHANRRRLWNRGMSSDALVEYEETLKRRCRDLVDALRKQSAEGVLDIGKWLNYFTFDFMGDMAFGGGSDMVKNGRDKDGLWKELKGFGLLVFNELSYGSSAHSFTSSPGQLLVFREYGMACAASRVKQGSHVKDLWYHLTDEAGLEKSKPPMSNVLADGIVAVIAGADTVSEAMTGILWLLISHPECYKRVEEEVDRMYPQGEDLQEDFDTARLGKMIYLNACINESLRLFPPVMTNGPRQVPFGGGGRVICGYFLAEGTQVYVPPYTMHRNPQYFSPEPDSFIPERWLSPVDSAHNINQNAFIPFSYGPANCVGKNLARMQMTMLVTVLLRNFTLEFAHGFEWENWPMRMKDFFVVARDPLQVKITPRSATEF